MWESKALASGGMFILKASLRTGKWRDKDGMEEMKGFFSHQIGTTLQMKIMCLGDCDKIEEKIAGDVFRAAPGAYLPVPLSIRDSVCC